MPLAQVLNLDVRCDIPLGRSAVRAHLLRLCDDLVQILLVQAADLDLESYTSVKLKTSITC